MKKELLLISALLFITTLVAQPLPFSTISSVKDSIDCWKKQYENKLFSHRIGNKQVPIQANETQTLASQKLELMRKAVETVNTEYLLDEVIVENQAKRTYRYSPEGKRVEKKCYSWSGSQWNPEENLSCKYDYKYDNQGRCISYSIFEGGIETQRLEIEYRDENRLYKYYEQQKEYYEDSNVHLIRECEYDALNRKIKEIGYSFDNLSSKTEFKYDENGKVIYYYFFYPLSEVERKETIIDKFSEQENIYFLVGNDGWFLIYSKTKKYDQWGHSILEEEIRYSRDLSNHGSRTIHTYDDYQRITNSYTETFNDNTTLTKEEDKYIYWGTQRYNYPSNRYFPQRFEGPLVSFQKSIWTNGEWEIIHDINIQRNTNGLAQSGIITKYIEGNAELQKPNTKQVYVLTFSEGGDSIVAEVDTYEENSNKPLSHERIEYKRKYYNNQFYREYIKNFTRSKDGTESISERGFEFDSQGREIMKYYKTYIDSVWSGEQFILIYEGELMKMLFIESDTNGEFNYLSASRTLGMLDNGRWIDQSLNYDKEGNTIYGRKAETKAEEYSIDIPNPEYYNDELNKENLEESTQKIPYEATFFWEDNDWKIDNIRKGERNGNIFSFIHQTGDRVMFLKNYIFDAEDKLTEINISLWNDENKLARTYEYNDCGLLCRKKDENGVVTTYTYSQHTINSIQKNTATAIKVEGHTITTENANSAIQIYSPTGILVASGINSVTIPESGIYIIVTNSARQKIVIP